MGDLMDVGLPQMTGGVRFTLGLLLFYRRAAARRCYVFRVEKGAERSICLLFVTPYRSVCRCAFFFLGAFLGNTFLPL